MEEKEICFKDWIIIMSNENEKNEIPFLHENSTEYNQSKGYHQPHLHMSSLSLDLIPEINLIQRMYHEFNVEIDWNDDNKETGHQFYQAFISNRTKTKEMYASSV